jgi:hypothetical protein
MCVCVCVCVCVCGCRNTKTRCVFLCVYVCLGEISRKTLLIHNYRLLVMIYFLSDRLSEVLPVASQSVSPQSPKQRLPLNPKTLNLIVVMLLPCCIIAQDPQIHHLQHLHVKLGESTFLERGQKEGGAQPKTRNDKN